MQDTPAIKQRYSANVTVPKDLKVFMSATKLHDQPEPTPTDPLMADDTVIFRYRQHIPIPSYLLAIAVGNIEVRKLGINTHVLAEP